MTKTVAANRFHSIQIFDSTGLKLLAAALMLLDHIHQMFYHVGAPDWLSMLGRLVFPIFLFCSAEAFHYTHSKKNYLLRLFIASICMVLFTTVLQAILPNDNVVLMNNAFSTFVVAGIYMLAWDDLTEGIKTKAPGKIVKAILWALIPVLTCLPILLVGSMIGNETSPVLTRVLVTLALMLPSLLTCEGGAVMAFLGLGFYIFRKHRLAQMLLLILVSAAVYFMGSGWQWMMGFAVIPLFLYNGRKGKGMKSFFYIYYPAHIGILYVISTLLFPA